MERDGAGSGDGSLASTPAWVLDRIGPRLPVLEYGTCSGVRVPAPADPRRLFDRLRPARSTPEHLPFEGALASVHRQFTEPGDDVVIVGGGYGITTVTAARCGASVRVYEPVASRRQAIRATLHVNDVDAEDVCLESAIVGHLAPAEATEKRFDADSVRTVAPDELPPCSLLELDCEGAELELLRGLEDSSLPRLVAVEIHPIKLDGGADAVVPTLRDRGYEVRERMTHDGISVSSSAFRELLGGETPGVGGTDHQEYPPVVVAGRE